MLFTVFGTALVAFTYANTRSVIEANARANLLQNLNTLVPSDRYDNDLLNDSLAVADPNMLGTDAPVTIYRARKAGQPAAVILAPVAPDGYSGDIKLLVAINADGTLAGVRVTAHRETPGLGDAIEAARSDWILKFTGRSLTDPDEKHWAVKKDDGAFDQFTGATITPRAVVKAVKKALIYFHHNRQTLFADAQPPAAEAPAP
ncbi:MAG: electron transport complex subunit RsxG [Gammaproteobacteria bacterium]|nr:electron transport complex subunit RsxG [Gammaproteobacteria bacterium]